MSQPQATGGGGGGLFHRDANKPGKKGPGFIVIAIEGVRLILAIVLLGLSAYLLHEVSGIYYTFDAAGLTLFTSLFTMLICGYALVSGLILHFAYLWFIHIALNALAAIFWLSSFADMAAWSAKYSYFNDSFNGFHDCKLNSGLS
jgi:hypothetical protein